MSLRHARHRAIAGLAMSLLVAVASARLVAPGRTATRKLIECGWDEPDPAFMRAHIAELEASPFGGVIYHLSYATPEGKPANFT